MHLGEAEDVFWTRREGGRSLCLTGAPVFEERCSCTEDPCTEGAEEEGAPEQDFRRQEILKQVAAV